MIVNTTGICQCIQEFGHPKMNQRYRLKQIIYYLLSKIDIRKHIQIIKYSCSETRAAL